MDGEAGGALVGGLNGASFVERSAPLKMIPGAVYSVSVAMRNSGETTWTPGAGYRLGSQSPRDNFHWGLNRVELNETIAPGQIKKFVFTLTAPLATGTYAFAWRMVHEGVEWFGDISADLKITVATPAPTPGWPGHADVLSENLVFAEVHPWNGSPSTDGMWTRWNDTGHRPDNNDILSHFWPAAGPYSTGDCNTVAGIGRNLKAAGVDVAVIDWIGGSIYPGESARVELMLRCLGIKSVIMVDAEPPWTGEGFDQVRQRLEAVIGYYSRRTDLFPDYYRDPVTNYPVYFVWDPASVASLDEWNGKIGWYKQYTPEHGIFVAGLGARTSVEWARASKFDGVDVAANGHSGGSDRSNFEWVIYSMNAPSNSYGQFIVGWSIPGFDTRSNCHDPNPSNVPRDSGNVFNAKWLGVLSANWSGHSIHSAYVPYHNDGEDAGIEPVSANPPQRGPGFESCSGRLPGTYDSYGPLHPTYYLEANAYWARQFKNTR